MNQNDEVEQNPSLKNKPLFGVLGAASWPRPECVRLSQGSVRLNSLVSLCPTEEVV